jgi:hypothetical protein
MTDCVKCGHELPTREGRPSRFCGDGCKAAVEAEQRRLGFRLRQLETARDKRLSHQMDAAPIEAVIADLQLRLDVLHGVQGA